jgi:hypothetical protein
VAKVSDLGTDGTIGSPFKKQRASLPGFDEGTRKSLASALAGAKERGNSEGNVASALGASLGGASSGVGVGASLAEVKMEEDDEEEL